MVMGIPRRSRAHPFTVPEPSPRGIRSVGKSGTKIRVGWRGMMYKFGLAVVLSLMACASALAQGTSTLNGRVTDPSSGVIAGATVTATNKATGVPRTTQTNSDGLFSLPALPAGAYDLKAESTGFAASVRQSINLVTDTTL